MKEADLLFELPPGFVVWREEMYEPLLIAVCLPLICHRPWRLAGTPQLSGIERELRRLREDPSRDPRAVLRQLCKLPPGIREGAYPSCHKKVTHHILMV
jgi:hypothetical protein